MEPSDLHKFRDVTMAEGKSVPAAAWYNVPMKNCPGCKMRRSIRQFEPGKEKCLQCRKGKNAKAKP